MSYRLKKGIESFDVVDGRYAGRRYARGQAYEEIPPEEKHKFELIKKAPLKPTTPGGQPPAAKKTTDSSKGGRK